MVTLTISTTGVGPNSAGNPSECHQSDVEFRRFFEPDADVVTLTLKPEQALAVAVDLLAQLSLDEGTIASWRIGFPERSGDAGA